MVRHPGGFYFGACLFVGPRYQTFGGLDGSLEAPLNGGRWGTRRMSEFILETEDLTKEFAGFFAVRAL